MPFQVVQYKDIADLRAQESERVFRALQAARAAGAREYNQEHAAQTECVEAALVDFYVDVYSAEYKNKPAAERQVIKTILGFGILPSDYRGEVREIVGRAEVRLASPYATVTSTPVSPDADISAALNGVTKLIECKLVVGGAKRTAHSSTNVNLNGLPALVVSEVRPRNERGVRQAPMYHIRTRGQLRSDRKLEGRSVDASRASLSFEGYKGTGTAARAGELVDAWGLLQALEDYLG